MRNEKNFTQNPTDLREKAEKILSRKNKILNSKLPQHEIERLVHELEVHHIELEMQAQELWIAEARQLAVSQKYSELYNFAPVGYFTLCREGKILDLNVTGEKILCKEKESLGKASFPHFIASEYRVVFNNFFSKLFESDDKESCRVSLVIPDRPSIFVDIEGMSSPDKQHCQIAVTDISKHK